MAGIVGQSRVDVFLSHSSADTAAVETVAERLRAAGVEPFLDIWHLTPGMPWQDEIAGAIGRSDTVAVFVGPSGFNPWHHEEMRIALSRAVRTRDEFRVIPVLLPGADEAALSGFLAQRTWVDFRPGLDDAVALDRLVAGVKGEAVDAGTFELPDHPAPYRGLLRYEARDAEFFFGRDPDIENLVAKLETSRFVAVVGASGSGKSSLVRAGLIPALSAGTIAGSDQWQTLVLTPGSDPARSLAEQVATFETGTDTLTTVDQLTERFATRNDGLRTSIGALTADDQRPVLIVVDQFEELFSLCPDSAARCRERAHRFVANLADAIDQPGIPIRVVITLRADFLDRALAVPQLKTLLQDHQVLLGAMDNDALRDVILRPAQAVGAFFEKGLVGTILKDVDIEPGTLPLLQHALYELWRQRRGPWLTIDAYDESGGVAGALRRRAQITYDNLTPQQQALTRTLFVRLTSLGEGVLDTRRRVQRSELYPAEGDHTELDIVLGALSAEQARLIVVDQNDVQITHEALLEQWDTLNGWLHDNREDLQTHRRLTQAAQEWEDLSRDTGALYQGAKLATAAGWADDHGNELNTTEHEFLEASRQRTTDELEAEQLRSRRLQRRLIGAIAALTLAVAGIAGALWALNRATNAEAAAGTLALEARTRELAVSSGAALAHDPQLAGLLAVEAAETATLDSGVSRSAPFAALYGVVASPQDVTLDHFTWVKSAVFSPDGTRIVTASWDDTARVWDLDGTLLATLSHGSGVDSAVFSPDGIRIVTASLDGTAKVWDVGGGLLATLNHDGWVVSAAFSSDGNTIVTASWDDTARVWDLDGTLLATLSHDDNVNAAGFSLDGTRIVTASSDDTAKVWSLDGDLLATLEGHSFVVSSAVFSPDGTRVVTASPDGTARVWNADGTLLVTLEGHGDVVSSAVFSPDGTRIVTASGDDTARVWSLDGGLLATLEGHGGGVNAAVFSPDGTRIVTASGDGTAMVWDPDGTLLATLEGHGSIVNDAVFGPEGTRIVTASEDNSARVWDLESFALATLEGHGSIVNAAGFSPDGNRIVTASDDDTARVWSLDGGLLATIQGHTSNVNTAVFSPDGTPIVTASDDGTAKVWSVDGGLLATLEGHGGGVNAAVFSPDGTRIVTASDDTTARVWSVDGGLVATLEGHGDRVSLAVFSPDGNRIVTASDDDSAKVWDPDGTLLATLQGHTSNVNEAVFSPEGIRIVTASWDETARVWSLDGTALATLEGHTSNVVSAGFSPDGNRIVTASWDDTARVWSLDGTVLATLEGHSGNVNEAGFSPDGNRIVTASADNTAKAWQTWTFEGALEEARRKLGDREFTVSECAEHRIDPCPTDS